MRLLKCKLIPVCMMKDIYDCTFLYNLLCGYFDVSADNFVCRNENNRTTRSTNDNFLLTIPRHRTEHFRNWYTIRVCYLWNKLPVNVRHSQPGYNRNTLNTKLKRELKVYCQNYFLTNFNIVNMCTWKLCCLCYMCRI